MIWLSHPDSEAGADAAEAPEKNLHHLLVPGLKPPTEGEAQDVSQASNGGRYDRNVFLIKHQICCYSLGF